MSPRRLFRWDPFTTAQDPTVEPEYAALCVSGDEKACGAYSGVMGGALTVDDWMRQHLRDTGHRHFRRTFTDFAELFESRQANQFEAAQSGRAQS
ncbi:hypothetical protein [Streptomyces kanamyceticus]|uniref:DUF7848 domain-containing protein n=1 Tax=Streptomyces kanamyceticus TaxID=1967 RepID=A0A5J6GI40_STRKN|nr:hypothetical protein [Streptomyces kanamyceticus]QEU92796.1 hypothetical protein CP970_19445 [Streptomyces kanamyceticus]